MSLYILFSGSIFAFIWAFGIFISANRRKSHKTLSYLLWIASIWLLSGFYYFGEFHKKYPEGYLLHLPLIFTCGPTFYLYYCQTLIEKQVNIKRFILYHFFIPTLVFILCIPIYLSSYEEKIQFILDFERKKLSYYHYLIILLHIGTKISLLSYIQYFIYSNWSIILKYYFSENQGYKLTILMIFFIYIDLLFGLIGMLSGISELVKFSALLLPANLYIFFLFSYAYPDMLSGFQKEIKKKYEQSKIQKLDVNRILSELKELMEKDKIFLEEKITLPELARELKISSHQLSEILNERMNKKFYDYINEYRIMEAKKLLTLNPEDTILSIAYAVGFNSKSAFNKAFKAYIGETPNSYRKNSMKKN